MPYINDRQIAVDISNDDPRAWACYFLGIENDVCV